MLMNEFTPTHSASLRISLDEELQITQQSMPLYIHSNKYRKNLILWLSFCEKMNKQCKVAELQNYKVRELASPPAPLVFGDGWVNTTKKSQYLSALGF